MEWLSDMCGISSYILVRNLSLSFFFFLIPIKYVCNHDTLLVNCDLHLETIYIPTACQGSSFLVNWSSILWVLGLADKRILNSGLGKGAQGPF